jgi:putative ABC transport system permease protein
MLSDIRFAFHQLLKSPGYTAVAVLTLALGIGVNTTNFSVLNALLFRPSPLGEPSGLVYLSATTPQGVFWQHSPAEFRDLRAQNSVFSHLAAYCWQIPSLAVPDAPAERLTAMSVSADFFPMIEVKPVLGRLFTPDEDRDGNVAVLSNSFWKGHFGGDSGVVGRVLRLGGKSVTVIGVMPAGLDDPITWGRVDLWEPLAYNAETLSMRDSGWLRLMARLRPGKTVAQAQAEMTAVAGRMARDFPQDNAQKGLKVAPFLDARVDDTSRRMSWLVMDLTLFVLLIACVNLANLQLARTTSHARDHAIRLALGSSRWRLVRQLLTESLVVSLAGGALGLVVARWGNVALGRRIMVDGTAGMDLSLDLRVVVFTFVASALTGAVFGIVPAWIASGADANAALKRGGRSLTGDKSRHRLRHALIVLEVAAALALLAGAGFFVRGTQRMVHRNLGWRPGNLLMGSMLIPDGMPMQERTAFFDRLQAGLAALPGVQTAVVSAGHAAMGHTNFGDLAIEGRDKPGPGNAPMSFVDEVTPGYFATLGISILSGRDFTAADKIDAKKVAIVNESMAKRFWPGENPIGRRIKSDPDRGEWVEIVGIVNDISIPTDFVAPPTPFQAYRPLAQVGAGWVSFTLLGPSDPHLLEAGAKDVVTKLNPDIAVYGLETVQERIASTLANFGLISWVLVIMAAIGLLLSSVGIYGVIANLAAQRTQEIGIRSALGAQRGDILWLIMRNGLNLSAMGAAAGVALAFTLTYVLGRAVPEVPGQSYAVTFGVSILIMIVALLACWLPALRATKVDPLVALRAD